MIFDLMRTVYYWAFISLLVVIASLEAFHISGHHNRNALLKMTSHSSELDPLLLRAARGEKVERTPVWMMRQAGRHMKAYRDLCQTYRTFRDRSENAAIATEIRYYYRSIFTIDHQSIFTNLLLL